jgi:hypothetical protein
MNHLEHEALVLKLNDSALFEAYKKQHDNYEVSFLPKFFGGLLVLSGNVVYGKKPSYQKFRAVEIIARVPYHSWTSAAYTLLTLFYSNEQKAIQLSKISRFARLAQDNETMHVVVISQIAKHEHPSGIITGTLIPVLFAFFYFWAAYLLYILNPKYALELNYLFEQHAFDQYDEFFHEYAEELKQKPVNSDFLKWCGRETKNQYDFFRLVRNDELVHRNQSIEEIGLSEKALGVKT